MKISPISFLYSQRPSAVLSCPSTLFLNVKGKRISCCLEYQCFQRNGLDKIKGLKHDEQYHLVIVLRQCCKQLGLDNLWFSLPTFIIPFMNLPCPDLVQPISVVCETVIGSFLHTPSDTFKPSGFTVPEHGCYLLYFVIFATLWLLWEQASLLLNCTNQCNL